MKEDWQYAIQTALDQVPPGHLLNLTQPPSYHPLFPKNGRGLVESFSLFPGVSLSHLVVQGDALPHHHPPRKAALEITHCRRGRVGWEMKDGLTLYLGPGDLSLHPMACCAHSLLRFPLGYYEGFSLSLDPETLEADPPPALAQSNLHPQTLLETFCPQGKPASLTAQPALDHIFLPLYDLPQALRLPYYTLKAQELLLFLSQLSPPAEEGHQYLSQQVELIRTIHDQLLAHPGQRTTIETLAKEHHINASTLKTVFKAVYGQPIAAHMKHHRMQEAARLLRQTDQSIGEIAQQVGYENQSKFSTVFRDVFQVLPTEYRKQYNPGSENTTLCSFSHKTPTESKSDH